MKNNEINYNDLLNKYLDLYKESEDLYKENIHIYYDYNYTFGAVYYKRYNLYYLCERLTKKIEIYYSHLERHLDIEVEKIDKYLDEIFEELIKKVNLIKNEYNEAIIFKNLPYMNTDDTKEVISLYTEITKYIHPDVCDLNDDMKNIWKKAKNAYRHNDIESLRECKKEIDNLDLKLKVKINREIDYEDRIKKFKDNIEILTSKNTFLINSFPYNKKDLLKNKELINNKIKEVEQDIKLFEDRLNVLEDILEEFLDKNEKYIC